MADGGGPTEQDRNEGMPSISEAPNDRGKSAWLLTAGPRRLLQVTRRKGETNSRRYRRNGYAPPKKAKTQNSRLSCNMEYSTSPTSHYTGKITASGKSRSSSIFNH